MTKQIFQKGLGLGTKFSLLVISILVITLGLNTYKIIKSQNELFKDQLEQRGVLLGYFTSLISPEAILSYDFVSLGNVTREVTQQNDIVYAIVVDPRGKAITNYLDEQNKFIISAKNTLGSNNVENIIKQISLDERILSMEFPITIDDDLIGKLLLGMSTEVLAEQKSNMIQRQLLINGLIIIFLVACIYFVFHQSVLRSIRTLVEGYSNVVMGKLDKPLKVTSHDELGLLTDSFNKMVNQLKVTSNEKNKALDDLNELNSSLEAIVEEQVSELRSKEARLSSIFDNINDGIVVIDESGFIESMNKSALSIFDAEAENVLGARFEKMVQGQTQGAKKKMELYDDELDGPFALKKITVPIEYQAVRSNGNIFPLELVGTEMVLGKRRFRICVLRDVTERKETERKLLSAQMQIVESAHKSGMAEIATGVLHNIGNILNSVSVSIEELKRILEIGNVSKLEKANQLLESNITKIGDYLTNDDKGKKLPKFYMKLGGSLRKEHNDLWREMESLADKSSMMRDVIQTQQQYAKSQFYEEALSIEGLVEDAVKLHQLSFAKENIQVKVDIDPLLTAMGQKSKLLQVITNLLINAKQALEQAGKSIANKCISITGVQEDDYIVLSIRDNGVGIVSYNIEKIFVHGFTTKNTGHGFGLHTSANAMTEMNGMLIAQSDGENQGACFIIKIPVATTAEKSSEKSNIGQ